MVSVQSILARPGLWQTRRWSSARISVPQCPSPRG